LCSGSACARPPARPWRDRERMCCGTELAAHPYPRSRRRPRRAAPFPSTRTRLTVRLPLSVSMMRGPVPAFQAGQRVGRRHPDNHGGQLVGDVLDETVGFDVGTADRMVRSCTCLLERVGANGVTLTSAGHPPSAYVVSRRGRTGPGGEEEWIGKGNLVSQTTLRRLRHSGRWMLHARSMRYLDDDDRRAVETGRSRASTASCCGIALQSSHAPVSPVSLPVLHLIGSMRPVMTRQWSGGAWPVPALG